MDLNLDVSLWQVDIFIPSRSMRTWQWDCATTATLEDNSSKVKKMKWKSLNTDIKTFEFHHKKH